MKARDTLLVDAKNLIYRAHFSHKSLTGANGFPTSVLFGASNMILDVVKKLRYPDVIVCWDGEIPTEVGIKSGPNRTWRHSLFSAYKGNRKVDEDHRKAILQTPKLGQMFRWFGFRQIGCETLEADDLIGMLTPMLRRRKYCKRVYVYSNDKDVLQVATKPDIIMVVPDKKKGGNILLEPEDIKERYGMTPEEVPLVKALAGDSTDNYKGLYRIGDVKALEMIHAGIDPSISAWGNLPAAARQAFPNVEKDWGMVHTFYKLAKIPVSSKHPYFLQGYGEAVESMMLTVVRNRRRRMSRTNYQVRKRKFERLCVEHNMRFLLARRNEFFRGIEIER